MGPENKENLVAAWIEMHQVAQGSKRYDELFWSFRELDDLVSKLPETAWEIILEILHADRNGSTWPVLAAGPLEDLLGEHGERFIDRVEAMAVQDADFRSLLGGVWHTSSMSEELWQRIERCAIEPNPAEKEELVNAWIELQKVDRSSARYDELFWSHLELDYLIQEAPEVGWGLILRILKTDKSPEVLVNLSTGPLMELLSRQASVFIDGIELEAATNPDFRKLLAGTWQKGMDEEIWKRIQTCWDSEGWEELAG